MPNRRLPLLLGVGLALSLAVNLFLLGDFAGRASFHPQARPAAVVAGRLGIFARYQALPQADRARFRQAVIENNSGLRDAQRDLRAAQAGVLAALRADPYDQGRMLEAFAALRTATTGRQVALQSALATAFATLSPTDRAALAGP